MIKPAELTILPLLRLLLVTALPPTVSIYASLTRQGLEIHTNKCELIEAYLKQLHRLYLESDEAVRRK